MMLGNQLGSQAAFASKLKKFDPAPVFVGYQAAFVLEALGSGERICLNESGCRKRYSPCSTFKIFNSLVGLETGVLRNENHVMAWDGTKYGIESWNRGQSLQSAVNNSCVWYFQRVATRVGIKRMRSYIEKSAYGNMDIKGGVRTFWLDSSLSISPFEQIEFLKRLVKDDLPFSKRSTGIVRCMLRQQESASGILYGKTGSSKANGKNVLGWYVGYLVQPQETYVFATNIRADDGAWGPKAKALTITILKDMKLL